MSDYIPEENLTQILKCLPVESLLRFRCVCKWWKQLIDSPSFVLHHLAVQKPRILAAYEEPEFLVLDPQTLPLFDTLRGPAIEDKAKQFHLIGTLHGIVCLYDNCNDIYLWNPSMCKFSNATPLPKRMRAYKWHPCESNYGVGTYSAFWIDPSTKSFKIVLFKLLSFENDLPDYGAIYSSIEGDWKELPVGNLFNRWPLEETPAVMIQGVAYWRAFHVSEPDMERQYRFDVTVGISFDFMQERFDTIDAPFIEYREDWFHPVLCNWQNHLSVMYFCPEKRCHIYLRQEGSWVKMFAIDLPSHVSRVFWLLSDMEERDGVQVGEMQQNKRILVQTKRILASTTEETVVLFDTSAGCMPLKSGLDDSDRFYVAHDFVESLLFP